MRNRPHTRAGAIPVCSMLPARLCVDVTGVAAGMHIHMYLQESCNRTRAHAHTLPTVWGATRFDYIGTPSTRSSCMRARAARGLTVFQVRLELRDARDGRSARVAHHVAPQAAGSGRRVDREPPRRLNLTLHRLRMGMGRTSISTQVTHSSIIPARQRMQGPHARTTSGPHVRACMRACVYARRPPTGP